VREDVNPDGESVYQGATVLVLFSAADVAVRLTYVLNVDDLVFDRPAADLLIEYYRPPGASLLQRDSIGLDVERLTYATLALAAYIDGADTSGRDPGVYIEEFWIDPGTGRVLRIVSALGVLP
jgi:hypothetical protein